MNPALTSVSHADYGYPLHAGLIADAEERLKRFSPFIRAYFPETEASGGLIESALTETPAIQQALSCRIPGRLVPADIREQYRATYLQQP